MEYVVIGVVFGLFLTLVTGEPKSTVILLPDDDGKVGEVLVSNQTGSQTINTAYTAIQVEGDQATIEVKSVSVELIEDQYQSILEAQPNQVTNYILYFKSGSSELTEASQQELPKIMDDIRSRKIYEAYVIGHTDTVGSFEQNHQLGLKRANLLKQLMEKGFPGTAEIQVNSHGEGNLLIPTADNVDEPKNRRVEIEIH